MSGAYLVDIEATNDKRLALNKLHFDVLFSSNDWKGSERHNKTEKDFDKVGVPIVYLPYTKGISTSQIKEELKE